MIALPTTQKLQKRRNSKREPKLRKKPKLQKSKGNKRAAATKQQQLETNQIFERAKAKIYPKLQRSKGNKWPEAKKQEEPNKNRSCTKAKATREQSSRVQKASSSSFRKTVFTATHSSKPRSLPQHHKSLRGLWNLKNLYGDC